MLPVFGFAYFLYGQMDIKPSEVLDKSFSATLGVFGGVATLAAAYIAARLVVNWKDQTRHNEQLKLRSQMINETMELLSNTSKIRGNTDLASHIFKIYSYISIPHTDSDTDSQLRSELSDSAEKNYIDSSILEHNIIQLRNLYLQLKLYEENPDQNCQLLASIVELEKQINSFRTLLSAIYTDKRVIKAKNSEHHKNIWKFQAAYISQYAYVLMGDENEVVKKNATENIQIFQDCIDALITNINTYTPNESKFIVMSK